MKDDPEYRCYREEAIDVAYEDFKLIAQWFAKGIGDKDVNNCIKILLSEFAQRALDEEVDELVE